jgi:WD40 repeat protein/serine/threonine protein kinase
MSDASAMLKEVFSRALDCPSAAERDRYLAEACAGNAALRAEVETLLRAHAQAGEFLEEPARDDFTPQANRLSGETAAEAGAESEEWSLDFLAPPRRAGSLGRLDHYEVTEVIGRGGMGIVLKAFDEKLHRVVAVKVMAPAFAASPLARKRFVREAQAAAAVRHEHVIDIHAVEDAGPLPYLVMECIVGISLEDRIRRSGHLQLKEVLRIGMQIAQGLAAAHAQGLVHRDIKPANILLENGVEQVKITDFGLARPVKDASITLPGIIAGTPQFMAPEQARAGPIDRRADLFSLGSVLYTLCTGQPPFVSGDPLAVLRRVCDETPRPIRQLNPEVPDWLAAIVERLHAKEPADRIQSAAEVAEQLANGLAHVQQPSLVSPPTPVRRPRRPKPVRRWALVAVLVLAVGLGAFWFGSTVYLFLIGKGRLEIQTDDPYVKLLIKKGIKQVALLDLESDAFVELDPGDYDLKLTDGRADLRLGDVKIALRRGDHQVVRVTEDPSFVGEVRRFEGHEGALRSVAFAPNRPWAVSGSHDKTVRLWDLRSGKEMRRLVGHTEKVTCVAFAPDGDRVLSASDDKTVRQWDTQTGKQIGELLGHTRYVVGLALTRDGRQAVSASYDQTLALWDLDTGNQVRAFQGHKDAVWGVAISSDGKRVLSGSWDGSVRLWDIATGQELRTPFTRHDGRVWPVAFSPDGRLAASGGNDSKIWLCEAQSGKELHCLSGHDGFVVTSLAFSPDGRSVLSGGSDASMRLWDVHTGKQRHRFDCQRGDVWGVAISADGRHALSASGDDRLPNSDNVVRLWRLPSADDSR